METYWAGRQIIFAAIIDFFGAHPYKPPHVRSYQVFGPRPFAKQRSLHFAKRKKGRTPRC